MTTDKQIKQEFKKRASQNPDRYYATSVLREHNFTRKQCKICNTFFWSTREDELCGSPECEGGFKFIGDTPAKNKLDYLQTWKEFSKLFKKLGYTPIERYPVVARWRDDIDFVGFSIADFQPYVVTGEIKPPANPLIVPQFCLRFNDIDNVGITGAHYTGFVMIGQHAFQPPNKYDQDQYFHDIYTWLREGIGLENEEIKFHEDAWAGGGNFGPCMEYFSRGLELGNQVYMLYEQTPSGPKELNLKVLDMGMGQERNAWFTQGDSTSYEVVFPTVCKKLYQLTGLKPNQNLIKKFLPYSSLLNIDEAEDLEKVWKKIAAKLNMSVNSLKDKTLPLAALYSIGEHTRSLLVAISDSALPSNIGGGYNLRVLLRRMLSFMDKYNWNISLPKLCELHAAYLKPQFPELKQNLKEVSEILEVEKRKYYATKEKSKQLIQRIIRKPIKEDQLMQLYDSQGIQPEIIKQEAEKLKKKIDIPKNFYAKIALLHEKTQPEHLKEEFPFYFKIPKTEILYYGPELEFQAHVLKIIGNNVILDKTAFYPTSGGQLHDAGFLNESKVFDVIKQNNLILHKAENITFQEGDLITGRIDSERRNSLMRNHTAAHIINATARAILGNHINQAGSEVTPEKARLDITHYEAIDENTLEKIEEEANKIVKKNYQVKTSLIPRDIAEKRHGFRIYQGGAVPGKLLRIVEIKNIDVECCGGTHVKSTKDVKLIKIIKTTKIQDGVVRLEFTAGEKALEEFNKEKNALKEISSLLKVKPDEIPSRVEELFEVWKQSRKALKKKIELKKQDLELKAKKAEKKLTEKEILQKTAQILSTQTEHIQKTIERFLNDLEEVKKKLAK